MHTHNFQVDVKWTETYCVVVEAEHLDEAQQKARDMIDRDGLEIVGARQYDGDYMIDHICALPDSR